MGTVSKPESPRLKHGTGCGTCFEGGFPLCAERERETGREEESERARRKE